MDDLQLRRFQDLHGSADDWWSGRGTEEAEVNLEPSTDGGSGRGIKTEDACDETGWLSTSLYVVVWERVSIVGLCRLIVGNPLCSSFLPVRMEHALSYLPANKSLFFVQKSLDKGFIFNQLRNITKTGNAVSDDVLVMVIAGQAPYLIIPAIVHPPPPILTSSELFATDSLVIACRERLALC